MLAVWIALAACLLVYVTVLFVRATREGKALRRTLPRWIVDVFDVLSGLG